MESVLKTKEVSDLLGVNPTTVQRWVKYFNIHCQMNEHGHYLFQTPHVETLKEIQGQLNEGKKMKDVMVSNTTIIQSSEQPGEMIPTFKYEQKLEEMMMRIEELEQKLDTKADDVVTYQLLNHRKEIEAMSKSLLSIEQRLDEIDEVMKQNMTMPLEEMPQKRRSLMQFFSF
ncbi:chromosome-anchoring protein RacA [Alkalihalobacterium alkalinitrilicum]|uniref:chromosome-anchoring protein RacA n=1 Tax=Alkalihalobacterium alkalinitrilicum TaxID=427920 RepID=UPI000994CE60|nr:chromosome-anchoring protein RacA [Alkalihalobacterium alkalinitrilicum]